MKPHIREIAPYVPGTSRGADGRELVKLSANENPLGCSPAAKDALAQPVEPARYPDPDCIALRSALGDRHGIDPARIVCGTGSGELLQCAVQAFAGAGDEVLFSRFAFSLYPLLAQRVGAAPVLADDDDYAASVDRMLAAVTPATRVILLDNPNNPTGTMLPHAEVARLHAGLPADVLLVLDQAYAEYAADEGLPGLALAGEAENVLVTRTFSKIHGLAALRVGWATGAPGLIDAINRIRGAFNVNTGAQEAALAAAGDDAFVSHARETNNRVRDAFAARLSAFGNRGVRVVPSAANFVLVTFGERAVAEQVRDAIAAAGYAVRQLHGPGLEDALRITIGSADDMARVGDAVDAALAHVAPR